MNGVRPSETALQDLEGDLHCLGFAFLYPSDNSGALYPPAHGEWRVGCGSTPTSPNMRLLPLSFDPICDEVMPDWKYTYPAEWTVVNVGCGDGIGRQRTEVQSCSAPQPCSCKNARALHTETEERCYVAFGGSQLEAD